MFCIYIFRKHPFDITYQMLFSLETLNELEYIYIQSLLADDVYCVFLKTIAF